MSDKPLNPIVVILTERFPDKNVPRGAWVSIADEVGLTRSRVQQVGARNGFKVERRERHCAVCRKEISFAAKTCTRCWRIPSLVNLDCVTCGAAFQRDAKTHQRMLARRKDIAVLSTQYRNAASARYGPFCSHACRNAKGRRHS